MKVIMKCVNIKLCDKMSCFHYILNAPRIISVIQAIYYLINSTKAFKGDMVAKKQSNKLHHRKVDLGQHTIFGTRPCCICAKAHVVVSCVVRGLGFVSIGTALANSVEVRGIRPQMCIEDLL